MIHPLWCLFGVLFTYIASFSFFKFFPGTFDDHFFVTVYALIAFYTLYAIAKDKTEYDPRPWNKVLTKALWKFFFWGFLLKGAMFIYSSHPFYETAFPNALIFVKHFFSVYLYVGFFYLVLSEKYRSSALNTLQDPSLRILSFFCNIFRGEFKKAFRRLKNEPYRNFFVASLLRMHFMPIMVEGLSGLNGKLFNQLQDPAQLVEPIFFVTFLTTIAWCIDSNNAAAGYFWESNFTKTKFRKVDPYPLHWIITLSCYAPFNNFVNTFIKSPMDNSRSDLWIESVGFQLATDSAIMVLAMGYAFAGTSLAFSWSNLSYKQIQTRGFYSLVRHPGTLCKLGFFSIMIFRHKSALTVGNVLAFAGWITIYLLRTLCEERFLKSYPEYQAYMKKTKYRVIPGVF